MSIACLNACHRLAWAAAISLSLMSISVAHFKGMGKQAEIFEIQGDGGHLDGVLAIDRASNVLRQFLSE